MGLGRAIYLRETRRKTALVLSLLITFMLKILFIGGSGNISSACVRAAIAQGMEVHLLNRGNKPLPHPAAKSIIADIHDEAEVANVLQGQRFDVVANFIAFNAADIERDFRLFRDKTDQYLFISSASAYQKPLAHPIVTESTPLKNPFWDYSRDKIAAEERLNQLYRDADFPMTIVRPSLTYETVIPVALGSWDDYTIVQRMKAGKEVVVQGDGASLWTITHSEDFAKGFVGLLGHQQALGHAFHITSDELLTWDQVYEAVGAAVGVKPNIVHVPSDFMAKVARKIGQEWLVGNFLGDKSTSVIFDNSKIKTFVPGFTATIPFKQGIKRTIEWFEADPKRMVIHEPWNETIDAILAAYHKAFSSI